MIHPRLCSHPRNNMYAEKFEETKAVLWNGKNDHHSQKQLDAQGQACNNALGRAIALYFDWGEVSQREAALLRKQLAAE